RDQSADPVAGVDAAVPALANAAVSDDGAAEDDGADAPAAIAEVLEALGLGGGGGGERGGGDGGGRGDSEDGLAGHGFSPCFCFWWGPHIWPLGWGAPCVGSKGPGARVYRPLSTRSRAASPSRSAPSASSRSNGHSPGRRRARAGRC